MDPCILMKRRFPTKTYPYVQTMLVSVMLTFALDSTYFWEPLLWNPLFGFPGVKDTLWAAFSAKLSFSFSSSFLVSCPRACSLIAVTLSVFQSESFFPSVRDCDYFLLLFWRLRTRSTIWNFEWRFPHKKKCRPSLKQVLSSWFEGTGQF